VAHLDFVQSLHSGTKRDYRARLLEHDKAACAEIACRFDAEYWDGPRQYGYGGYRYDGRWRPLAETLARHYDLRPGQHVLDVGCGKAYLAYELTQAVPGLTVVGLDISGYALRHAKPELAGRLIQASADALPCADGAFDAVISLGTLHNLPIDRLVPALREIARVTRPGGAGYVMVESWRNEREKANLLAWQLTCQSFHSPAGWQYLADLAGYRGDLGFIYFE